MSIEATFTDTLIRKAEARLNNQAAIVGRLPSGCTMSQAVQACDLLQSMNDKVVALKREREKLGAEAARLPPARKPGPRRVRSDAFRGTAP